VDKVDLRKSFLTYLIPMKRFTGTSFAGKKMFIMNNRRNRNLF